MIDKIEILLLEDNRADAELVKNILAEENIDFNISLAESRLTFEAILTSGKNIDIIISSCSVKEFDCFTALRIAQEKKSDIPFILLTGILSEEQAIEAMKLGVSDYVLRQRIFRLGPVVRRAVREAKEHKEYLKNREYLILLNRAVEASRNGVFITDNLKENNPVIFVNNAFQEITGMPEKDILNKSVCSVLNIFSEKKSCSLIDYVNEETGEPLIIKDINKNKIFSRGELYLSPVRNEDGCITNFIGVVSEITERIKQQEEILKLSRAVRQSPASIIITDDKGIIEYVNEKFEETSGYKPEEVIGKHPVAFIGEEISKNVIYAVRKVLYEKGEYTGEFKGISRDGKEYWELIKVSVIRNKKNEIINYIITQEDITPRKKAEDEMQIAKERAEELNMLKTAFLSNMSHELRTPMVGILGCAKILLDEITDSDHKELAEIIYSSGTRLTETLDLILDLSIMESGSLNVNLTAVNPAKIIQLITEKFRERALRKEIFLNIDIKENALVIADQTLLLQVLNHLLNNAIKFTTSGGVTIELDKEKIDDENFVVIKITDTGIGISKENQFKIFEPFRQESEGLSRNYEGTGIGLTVAKKFVDLINGRLILESETGYGSIFKILLPAFTSTSINGNGNGSKNLLGNIKNLLNNNEKFEILLVEDDTATSEIIRLFLNDFCNIDRVDSGEDAVDSVSRKFYDAVLMDIRLKGMNGLKAAGIIRQIKGFETLPIIAVTAYAMAGDKEKLIAGGCSHYISKPFLKKDLVHIVKKAILDNHNNRFKTILN